jgi:uncharacterized protein
MNILYLHGLKSKLSEEKCKVLKKYGKVFSPNIDYSREHIQYKTILQSYPNIQINVIIGSSMGALNGYIISNCIGRPALLFNPPLSKHPKNITLTGHKFPKIFAAKQNILGANDNVVDPKETLAFLIKHLEENELEIKIDPELGHRIPLDHFKEEVAHFFSKLCY